MPNCYFDVRIVSRRHNQSTPGKAAYNSGSKLTSVVANAAYRSGEALYDARAGKTFDYQHKEDVLHSEVIAGHDAPDWALNREALWNAVEAFEKRKDSQLARSFIAALPRELNEEQNIALARRFVVENFVHAGLVADMCIHTKIASDGFQNPHCHILVTMREVNADGFALKKNPAWDSPANARLWRNSWETLTNEALEAAGRLERLSLQSYQAQGIDKIPQTHMGYGADKLEKRKGVETKPGNQNRKVRQENAVREVKRSRQAKPPVREALQGWYQAFYDRAHQLREMDYPLSVEAREGSDTWRRDEPGERRVVAQVEESTWFGFGDRTRLTLYQRKDKHHYPADDPDLVACHRAFLQAVLRDNSTSNPIWVAESVHRLEDYLYDKTDEAHEYDREGTDWQRPSSYPEYSQAHEQERER